MTEHTPTSPEPSDYESSDSSESPNLSEPAAALAPPATRTRLPGWAWVLIIGGPVLLLMAAGAAMVAIDLAVTASQDSGCDDLESCSERNSSPSSTSAGKSPVDDAETTSRVTLDGHAVFDSRPEWTIQLEPTWLVQSFDQDGINVFRDEATNCQLVTSQSLALPDPPATNDYEVSNALLYEQIVGFTVDDPEAMILDLAATDISIATVGSGSMLEFTAATITRTNPTGVHETVEIVARSMPDSESALVAALTCDTDVYETFSSHYGLFSKSLAVAATH